MDEVSWLLAVVMPLFTAFSPLPFLISWSSLHVGAEGQCLLGEGLQRDQDLTQGKSISHKEGGVSATNSAALFIHLFYLGNVTGSTRNILALMCCLNAYNKPSGFTKCQTLYRSSQRE